MIRSSGGKGTTVGRGAARAESGAAGGAAKYARTPSRAGLHTRTKLLDAAERLFADKGYDGSSLREIADKANLHGALSTYYFGTKERLFDEVVGRRAVELEEQRLANLARIDPDAQSPSETVRLLIIAYVSPMIAARYGSSTQRKAYVRLMAGVINVKRWTPLIRKHYDNCAQQYLNRWRAVLPHAREDSLLNAFSFMVATMLYVCSYTDRFRRWKSPQAPADKVETMTEDLIRFVHGGFMAL